ncbi:hypothetical protein B0H65DRAFT_389128, partial [Neurospora tetraspora]
METNRASGSQQPADNVDEDPSGVHEVSGVFQEPFTPEELLVAQNCVLPSSFNPEPSIRQIITQMAIYHKIRFQSCESAKLNSNINVPSTASDSRPLDYAPDALGPATPFQLYHPVASPVGHQLAGSNIGNPNSTPRPSRLALGVPVGPPIVSQEKCDALAGRCNSLV